MLLALSAITAGAETGRLDQRDRPSPPTLGLAVAMSLSRFRCASSAVIVRRA